jgi:hypothetical protein
MMPPWSNLWLIAAIVLSFSLHMVILNHNILSTVFHTCPLTEYEWITVLKFSLPVVLLDETLKFATRRYTETKKSWMSHVSVLGIIIMWGMYILFVWKGEMIVPLLYSYYGK